MRRESVPFLILIAVLALPAAAGAFRLEETWQKSFPVKPGAELVLDNTNGSIRVEAWDAGSIEVTAEIRIKSPSKSKAERLYEGLTFDVESDSARVAVEARLPRLRQDGFIGLVFGQSTAITIRYTVKVPRETRLRLTNVNGDIDVDGASGAFILKTTNGGVEARFIGGEGEVKTVNGAIDFSLERLPEKGEISLHTVNGDIDASLPSDISAAVDASVMNGGVDVDIPATRRLLVKRGHFKGVFGGGEGEISLETTNGNISIRSNPL